MSNRGTGALLPVVLLVLAGCFDSGNGPVTSAGSDWPTYRGGPDGTGYSPLDRINAANVNALALAWSYSLDASEPATATGPRSQATPIVIDGVMYLPASDRVVALDAVDGRELWTHPVSIEPPSRRGVSWWPGRGGTGPRIFYTAFDRLVALDAQTGVPDSAFGEDGVVELGIPYLSVPLVHEDVIVVGANTPRGAIGGIGNARAYSAVDGAKLWEFESVPGPGRIGHDTWAGDSWNGRLGANAWPFHFTVDSARNHVYIPLASPLPFGYGGDRAGSNLFANSVVAVDVHSGEYAWHFQTIHHDLWDHDPPAPPSLFDLDHDGATLPALALVTKSGYLYLLNRETGEPVHGVEERPVAQSIVPGEQTSPTQPIPLKPAPLARVSYQSADLVSAADTNAEHAAACAELVTASGGLYNAGPFTPWSWRPDGSGGAVTLLFPGLAGGPNWGGAAHNPHNGYVYVFATDLGTLGWVEEAGVDAETPYRLSGPQSPNFAVRMNGRIMPCQKPPWGRLTAVDTASGDIAWQIPLGVSEGLAADKRHTGRPGRAGVLVTGSGLLFIGATDDNRLRALDANSGEILWETRLPGRGNANPMTYLGKDGKQYLVITATEQVLAFSVP